MQRQILGERRKEPSVLGCRVFWAIVAALALRGRSTQKHRLAIHGKKRKLHRLEQKLIALQDGDISVVFGSKKLFRKQFNLAENGYASHEEWLEDWREKRSNHVFYEGSKRFESGNLLCRLNAGGKLRITVPACLQHQFGSHVECDGIQFNHAQEWVDCSLQRSRILVCLDF